jgi:hypothetical protein
VSRFTRALAATTMAVAAAGGGLLIAAAGAVPASAAAHGAPHGNHKITMTAHARAHAGHGIGPHTILPCVAKPGSAIRPASCGDQTITCVITAEAPFVTTAINEVNAIAHVDCSAPVTSIGFSQSLLRNGSTVAADSFTTQGKDGTADLLGATCQAATWTNTAQAFITFPPGYVITGGQNPIHQTTSSLVDTCQPLVGGGGGGGGGVGCGAVHAPSLARHPAGRHPDLISCP